jgi:hypothetical protein
LLEFGGFECAQVTIEQLRHIVGLRRRQVAAGNGRRDVRGRREHARRAVERRKLEGNTKKPGAVSRPGAVRQFQFRE